jgi:hypothetical protein
MSLSSHKRNFTIIPIKILDDAERRKYFIILSTPTLKN